MPSLMPSLPTLQALRSVLALCTLVLCTSCAEAQDAPTVESDIDAFLTADEGTDPAIDPVSAAAVERMEQNPEPYASAALRRLENSGRPDSAEKLLSGQDVNLYLGLSAVLRITDPEQAQLRARDDFDAFLALYNRLGSESVGSPGGIADRATGAAAQLVSVSVNVLTVYKDPYALQRVTQQLAVQPPLGLQAAYETYVDHLIP